MKSFAWFVAGVVGGLVAGHIVANDPRGKALLADVNVRIREFTDGVKEGFDSHGADDSKVA